MKPAAAALGHGATWAVMIWRVQNSWPERMAGVGMALLVLPWLPNEILPISPVWIASVM